MVVAVPPLTTRACVKSGIRSESYNWTLQWSSRWVRSRVPRQAFLHFQLPISGRTVWATASGGYQEKGSLAEPNLSHVAVTLFVTKLTS